MDDVPLVFGPVPSRRLGQSLGVNNVPPKTCSYGCLYCQVGPTSERCIEPRRFRDPALLVRAVEERAADLRARGQRLDAITFVPDGEPTLDADLAWILEQLRPLGVCRAVITNGSLVGRPDVSRALGRADWVSLKVDSVDAPTWRRLDRPHPGLELAGVLDGVRRFAAAYRGTLATETMLVEGVNDDGADVEAVAAYLAEIAPTCAYLSVPTRPPSVAGVRPPAAAVLQRAHAAFARRLPRAELLIGYEGDAFGTTGDARRDLLAVSAVHPLRQDQAEAILARDHASADVLEALIAAGALERVRHEGHVFYVRRPRRLGDAEGRQDG